MKILIVEPGLQPRRADIPHTLLDMQQTVGGYIEIIRPFEDPVALVCDEEGKLKGYELNRAIVGVDIIAGTFFLVGVDDDDLIDLPDEMAEKYEALFRSPQVFVRSPRGILAISNDGTQELIQ